MKTKIVLLGNLLLTIFTFILNAQVSNYIFSESTSTYNELTNSTNIFSGTWDDSTPVSVNLPFTFYFNNIGYNAISVNPNGYLTFGETVSGNSLYTPISNNTAYNGAISALGVNLQNNSSGTSTISYGTIGTGNSRTFVVQWKNVKRKERNGAWNFQIRLNESTNIIDVHYGSCTPEANNNVAVQIGLRGFSNGDFTNRNLGSSILWKDNTTLGAANNNTVRSNSSAYPENGLNFKWTPYVPSPATIDYVEDFESYQNNWVLLNARQSNKWWIGNQVNNGGANALYISNDASGNSYTYNNTVSVVHAYRSIAIPTGTTNLGVYFDWRSNGDANGNDYLRTWLVPYNYMPVPGVPITEGGGRILLNDKLLHNNAWKEQRNEYVDVSSFQGTNLKLVFEWINNGSLVVPSPAAIDNVRILKYCTGAPIGGTATITPATGAPSSNFTINVVGNTVAAGVEVQWQIAETATGYWIDIENANSTNLTTAAVPTANTTRYYRRKVTCTATNQISYSNVVSFTTTAASYCTPTTQIPNYVYISSIKIYGFNDTPIINTTTYSNNGYSNYTTNNNLIIKQAQGEAINVDGVVAGDVFGRGRWKAWVDWNGDGDFVDSGELVYDVGGIVGGTVGFGFQVPQNQSIGKYRMRVRLNNSILWDRGTPYEAMGFDYSPCDNFNQYYTFDIDQYGETEDYYIEVIENCVAKIESITPATMCLTSGGSEVVLSAQASQPVVEFRWYDAAIGGNLVGTSLPDASGLSTDWITPPINSTNIYYVTAFNGNCESTFRTAIQATIKPTPEISFSSGSNEICGDSSVIEVSATGGDEVYHILNVDFEDGTLGGFTNQRISSNTNNGVVDFINRTSVFKPEAPSYLAWRPAVSAGFGPTKFAFFNSDANQGYVERGFRSQWNLSSVGLENLTLKFRMFFRRFYPNQQNPENEYATLEITNNNGGTWVELDRFVQNVGMASKFEEKIYHLPSEYLNQTKLAIRFRVKSEPGGSGWLSTGFAVDDIELFGDKPLEPSFTWNSSNPIGVYTDPEGTIEYMGGPISTVYIKPEQEEIETFTNWNVLATATLQNGCNAQGTINIVNQTKLWDESSIDWTANQWKPTTSVPTANNCVIIRKPVSIPTGIEAFAKNIIVEETGKVEIESLSTLTITDNIKVNGPAETFVVKHDANLLQLNPNANNVGAIQVEKQFNFVNGPIPADDRKQYNFVISPVVGQNIKTIYPGNPTVIQHREANNLYYNHNGSYVAGQGLSVREPSKTAVPTSNVEAKFKGVPFNGNLSYPIAYTTTNQDVEHGFNLIGNPYPSNLNIESLYDANSSIIEPNFYFWDNRGNTLYVQHGSNYSGDNFAKYNAASGTGVGTGQAAEGATDETRIPNQYVKVGTAFMVRALPTANGQSIQFSNDYRTNVNSGPGFFGKINDINEESNMTKDRYWLSFTTPNNVEFMNAIVYFPQGNNGFGLDDTETFGGSNDIYSLIENYELAIQGKELFHNSDVVPIGFRAFQAGIHKIGIMHSEGIFADGQKIYLKDKDKNIVHDLTLSPYEFKSAPGQFNQRFEIIYKRSNINMSSTKNFKNEVEIKKVNGMIQVTSSLDNLSNVEIFSLTGKSLYKKINFESKEIQIPMSLFNNEIIILNALTDKGEWYSKKFIIN